MSLKMYFVKVACVYLQFVLMLPRLYVSFSVFFFCDFCGNTNAVSVFFSTILACLFIIYLKMKISFIVHFLPTECSWSSL